MTAETGLLANITQAEAHVRNARRCWNPTSLEACEQCAQQLRQAVERMLAARQSAGSADVTGAKARLTRLHNEVEVLSRLVDSASAFSRGLALRMIGEERVCSELKG